MPTLQRAYPFQVGEIYQPEMRLRSQPNTNPYYVVLSISSRYISDDGWSSGLQAYSGTMFYAEARTATDEEVAVLVNKTEAREAIRKEFVRYRHEESILRDACRHAEADKIGLLKLDAKERLQAFDSANP